MLYYSLSILSLIVGKIKNKYIKIFSKKINYTWIIGIILIILASFRSENIGLDMPMYKSFFMQSQSISDYISIYGYKGHDYGYYLLSVICRHIGDFRFLLIATSIISIAPVIYIIDKYSPNKGLSLAIYIMFGYYTFCFSGLRQACALGFCVLAYDCVKKQKLKMYLLFVLLAISFHFSALIFLPVYWLNKIPFNRKTIFLSVVSILLVIIYRDQIVKLASLFQRVQEAEGYSGSYRMCIFILFIIILGIFFYKKNIKNKSLELRLLLLMQIIGLEIWIFATSFNDGWLRIMYYYHMFIILYIPTMLKNISDKKIRIIVEAMIACAGLYMISSQIIPPEKGLNPYSFM